VRSVSEVARSVLAHASGYDSNRQTVPLPSCGKKCHSNPAREAEQREKPYIDTGPRLRAGLLCVDADGTFFPNEP